MSISFFFKFHLLLLLLLSLLLLLFCENCFDEIRNVLQTNIFLTGIIFNGAYWVLY